MADDFQVMLSSAGRRVALMECFRRALADLGLRGGVVAMDAGLSAPAAHAADAFRRAPLCGEPGFLDAVARTAREEGVGLIVPTIDPELIQLKINDLPEPGEAVAETPAEALPVEAAPEAAETAPEATDESEPPAATEESEPPAAEAADGEPEAR